jgi:hypothetical protein
LFSALKSNVIVSPNPARTQVKVSISNVNTSIKRTVKDIRQIRILDKLGNIKKVMKYAPGTKSLNFDVYSLPADIYMLEVSDGVNSISVQLNKVN